MTEQMVLFDSIPTLETSEKRSGPRLSRLHTVGSSEGSSAVAAAGDPHGLRGYQREAVNAILRELETVRSTLAVMFTGAGKTQVGGSVIRSWTKGRILWLAHRDELLSQAQRRIEAMTGRLTSLEQAGQYASGTQVVVGSVQSLRGSRLERWPHDQFGLVIIDECFPAGTPVDGMRIETIRPGDKVWSLDHETGQVVLRPVLRVMKRTAKRIHTLQYGASRIECTPNHPLFVKGLGYVTAEEIVPGDMLAVWKDVRDRNAVGPRDMLRRVQKEEVIGDHGSYQPGPRIGQDEVEQSNAQGFLGEDARDAITYWAQAAGPWWKRPWPDQGRVYVGIDYGYVDQHSGTDRDSPRPGIPHVLQDRCRRPCLEDWNRSGWDEPQSDLSPVSGPKEDRVLEWARVDHISSQEQGGAGGIDVYNLEVEGTHTYFANGVLAHNCHHAPSKSYRAIVDHLSAAKVLGITATADRLDKVGQHNVFDTVAYRKDIFCHHEPRCSFLCGGIDEGYLVPMLCRSAFIDSVNLAKIKTVSGDLALDALEEEILKAAAGIVDATLAEVGDRRSLTFTPGVASAHKVCDTHNQRHPGSAHVVDGKTHPDKRREIFKAHRRGEFQHLVNCMVATEGYDDVGIAAIVNARPTKSRALATQIWGRGLRVLPGIGELPTVQDRLSAIAASAKPNCLLLDATGHPGKHKLISPLDLLAGRYASDVVAKAKEAVAKEAKRMEEALEEAVIVVREEDEERRRQEARAAADAEVRRRSGEWNPFLDGGVKDPDALRPRFLAKPATAKQRSWAQHNFLDPNQSCEQLRKLRGVNEMRDRFGKATFRLLGLLRKHGLPAGMETTTEQARQMLRGREWT